MILKKIFMKTFRKKIAFIYLIFMIISCDTHTEIGSEIKNPSELTNPFTEKYLLETVGGEYGKGLADNLNAFKKLLMKINTEMPWFWQTISGLEQSQIYEKLAEPYWGAKDPKLEIECLEENVDLTAISLMDLYKKSVFDFNRWIEIIPFNLRHFRMGIYITEIRQFQQDTHARDLNSSYKPSGPAHPEQQEPKTLHQQLNLGRHFRLKNV